LALTQQEVSRLTEDVMATQELASINLDLLRNRILRVEMQLGMVGLGVAASAR
ncbi:unnamed protein product, partial [Phaeothamnion confervicola]